MNKYLLILVVAVFGLAYYEGARADDDAVILECGLYDATNYLILHPKSKVLEFGTSIQEYTVSETFITSQDGNIRLDRRTLIIYRTSPGGYSFNYQCKIAQEKQI